MIQKSRPGELVLARASAGAAGQRPCAVSVLLHALREMAIDAHLRVAACVDSEALWIDGALMDAARASIER